MNSTTRPPEKDLYEYFASVDRYGNIVYVLKINGKIISE
jgi:hypothetical protein